MHSTKEYDSFYLLTADEAIVYTETTGSHDPTNGDEGSVTIDTEYLRFSRARKKMLINLIDCVLSTALYKYTYTNDNRTSPRV